MDTTRFALAVLLGCALLPLPAGAQKMYRCGNTFQDRPCTAAQASPAAVNAAAAPADPVADADCRQRGADAQKMAWAREAGQTREQQLEKIESQSASPARKGYERELVAQVYEQRGSSAAVRAAIEGDCAAQKQKAAETAAAAKALGLQPPPAQHGIPSAAPASASPAAQPVQRSASAREAQRRQEYCESLNMQLEDVRSRQRAGGTAGAMENLGRQRRQIEDKISTNHC